MKLPKKTSLRKRRHHRIRAKLQGTAARPRLVVYRSLNYHYAQLVDDFAGKTIVGVSDVGKKAKKGKKIDRAKAVGMELAKKATTKGIIQCIFDRAGYKYHGRIKAIADGAREGGLKF